jgi:NADH-quinone oxidoreductase subunit I/NAD(P)H-quinone oxidoreductase subunit I
MANTNVRRYFKNLSDAVTTIFEGMSITCSHFVRKPYTIQYPDRIPVRIQDTLPPRYRGILAVDLEICTGCLACERACPIDCIVIDAPKDQKNPPDGSRPL